ncbi:MAG: CoA-binding protein [Desulfobacteraceae bacterium]|nr:CoA-binding protein [Desulfobacteraceae bacterium]
MKKSNHFLEHFFSPESVAVVGATNNAFKMNFRVMENMVNLNFQGQVYPVNPGADEILGIRAFAGLQDIPNKIDLVVSAVPASKTLDIVKDCHEIGAKHLVIISGGFSEGGQEGRKLHDDIRDFTREKGIRVLGPNTLSPINSANRLAISFNPIKNMARGGLSFAFQSGFYEPKINWILSHMGINKMLDMGNKMDINEVDALEYFSGDEDTKVIAMHIESLKGDVSDFFDLLKSVSREKPTIILKSGRTPAGSKAAASHTGSIARENDLIFDGMIKQTSAIRAQNMDEFFDLAKSFAFLELPKGKELAIITLSGGEGVMATDSCTMNGLNLASLSRDTYQRLKEIYPPWEIPLNPFDAGVCMEFHLSDLISFFQTLTAIPRDENVDCTIMQMPPNLFAAMLTNPDFPANMMETMREQFIQWLVSVKEYGKPFALWCSAMDTQEMKLVQMLEARSLPVFQSSERAIKSFSAMYRYAQKSSLN